MNAATEMRKAISDLTLIEQLAEVGQTLAWAIGRGDWEQVMVAKEVLGDIRVRLHFKGIQDVIDREQWRQGNRPVDVNQEAG